MTNQPCPPPVRRSGRTQWMIDQLCDAVEEGQSKCLVVGHTMQFALDHLKPRVMEAIQKRGLKIDRVFRERIEVESSVILFKNPERIEHEQFHRGNPGWGEFIDHYADGED